VERTVEDKVNTFSGNANTCSATTFAYDVTRAGVPVVTDGLFDVVVVRANEFELRPRTELAKSLLGMWLHGRPRISLSTIGFKDRGIGFGEGVDYATFKFDYSPLLSRGDDPFYTGMHLSVDEFDAAHKAVAELREQKQRGQRKPAAPPKAKPKAATKKNARKRA
jgi:hypothetical protein